MAVEPFRRPPRLRRLVLHQTVVQNSRTHLLSIGDPGVLRFNRLVLPWTGAEARRATARTAHRTPRDQPTAIDEPRSLRAWLRLAATIWLGRASNRSVR